MAVYLRFCERKRIINMNLAGLLPCGMHNWASMMKTDNPHSPILSKIVENVEK